MKEIFPPPDHPLPLAVIRCPLQTVDRQAHATILHNRTCNGWNQLRLAPVTCACAMPLTTGVTLSCDTLNFERKKGSRTEYRAGPHGQGTALHKSNMSRVRSKFKYHILLLVRLYP